MSKSAEQLASPREDLERARVLLMHSVSSEFDACGNSYINAYLEKWLRGARELGAYPEPLPLVGKIAQVEIAWADWLEENGGLPEIKGSPQK